MPNVRLTIASLALVVACHVSASGGHVNMELGTRDAGGPGMDAIRDYQRCIQMAFA